MTKISYELARELKVAGFPLETVGKLQIPDKETEYAFLQDGVWYVKPTLTRLIEFCGEKIQAVSKLVYAKCECKDCDLRDKIGFVVEPVRWYAAASLNWQTAPRYTLLGEYGDTPEEAVARLWLALSPTRESEK